MKVTADLQYDMFLSANPPGEAGDPWHEKHEMLHVQDIEDGVEAYFESLEKGVYPTKASCDAVCQNAKKGFPSVIQSLAAQSQAKRH